MDSVDRIVSYEQLSCVEDYLLKSWYNRTIYEKGWNLFFIANNI